MCIVNCNCNMYAEACPLFVSFLVKRILFWTVHYMCVEIQCNALQCNLCVRLYVFLGGNWRDLSPHTLSLCAHTKYKMRAQQYICTLCFVYFSICWPFFFVFICANYWDAKFVSFEIIYKCAHAFCLYRAIAICSWSCCLTMLRICFHLYKIGVCVSRAHYHCWCLLFCSQREREKKTLNAIEKCESKLKTSCDKGEEKKTHSTKTGIRLTRHSAKDMCTMKHPPAFRAEIFAIRKRFFIYKQNTIHLNYLLFIWEMVKWLIKWCD